MGQVAGQLILVTVENSVVVVTMPGIQIDIVLVIDTTEELELIITLIIPKHGGRITPLVLLPTRIAISAFGGAVGLLQLKLANVQVSLE